MELIIINTILTGVCLACGLKSALPDDFFLLHVNINLIKRILSHVTVCERTKALFL